jgi:DNA-binding cell septation regulator SpoVG
MQINVKMIPLKREDSIKAIGSVNLGEITVRNFTLMQNSKGELFLNMPNRDTGKTDPDGKKIYEEIAHPITKEMRDALNNAAIESYKTGHPVFLRDNEDGKLLIEAEAFDRPFYNRVGKGQMRIDDKFVIKDIFINEAKDKNLYVSFPNYKTNKLDQNGKNIYSQIIMMAPEFKQRVSEALINEFNMEMEHKRENRMSIKSRLAEANEKVKTQTKNSEKAKEVCL